MNIQSYLQNYNKNLSKIEINNAKLKTLKLLLENWDGSCESLKAQILDDMPRTDGDGTSKTEKALIKKEELEQRIAEMELDISYHYQSIQLVDSRMKLLDDDETFVIDAMFKQNISKSERISRQYESKFGSWRSPKTINRIGKRAIEKMK